MTPKQFLQSTLSETFHDGVGRAGKVELKSPLSDDEIETFQEQQPGPLHDVTRELLRFTRGFTVLGECVDFTGNLHSEFEPAFRCGIPIYTDRFGSFWVVHVNPCTGEWAPIFFTPYDPPVLVVQSRDLVLFLNELFNSLRPGHATALDLVYRVALSIWSRDRGFVRGAEVRNSPDPSLRAFTAGLKEGAYVADLRGMILGTGFAWGCFGADTVVKRHSSELLFAVEAPERKGFLRRLFRGR